MSDPRPTRSRLAHLALVVAAGLFAFLAPTVPARAQGVAGEPGGIPESGSLALANALASAALDPSTGVFTASLPFDMPAARGSAQPGLGLTYNSAAGIREAGVGWGLTLPSVERKNAYGPPRYKDPSAGSFWSWGQLGWDQFAFAGQPLLLVCLVKGAACVNENGAAIAAAQPLPAWATSDWLYFRLETDTSRARFYWSPDRRTWRVQFAGSGEILELGQPLVQPRMFGDPLDAGIDYDSVRALAAPVQRYPFRWNAVRRYDARSDPVGANLVAYRWARIGDRQRGFLTDVYDTPSATVPPDSRVLQAADFAHHARLSWSSPAFLRGLSSESFRSTPDRLLSGVDVTSQSLDGGAKQLVRRYHLSYLLDGNRYYLTGHEVEGRCAFVDELLDGTLPPTACQRLPATRLRYSARIQNTTAGQYGVPLPHEPGRPANFALVDINGDSLLDLFQTTDELPPSSKRRVWLQRGLWYDATTVDASDARVFSRTGRTVLGSGPGTGSAASLFWDSGNRKGVIMDAVLHPSDEWEWKARSVVLRDTAWSPSNLPLPPPAPFNDDAPGWIWPPTSVVGDVDGDGLPDGVYLRSASDGGEPSWPSTWTQQAAINTRRMAHFEDPNFARVGSCFGPSPVTVEAFKKSADEGSPSLVDMNGDGLGDLVFARETRTLSGDPFLNVQYWPGDGRGNFTSCTSDVCPCTAGGTEAKSVKFSPIAIGAVAGAQAKQVGFADLNGDGYADLVIAGYEEVRIFWNTDGRYFDNPLLPNLTIAGTEIAPNWKQSSPIRMSFADANGNGLTDAVFVVGDRIAFFDSQTSLGNPHGASPGLLIGIDNGLGASTEIIYESTASIAIDKGTKDHPWELPQALHVVKEIRVQSGLAGDEPTVVSYDYDNPFYDVARRAFRGFRNVSIASGGIHTDTTYLVGNPAVPYRAPLLISSEVSDGNGRYYAATIRSYRVRDEVLDASPWTARASRAAYLEKMDTLFYDTTDSSPGDGSTTATVTTGDESEPPVWSGSIPVRSRTNARTRMTWRFDDVGNIVEHIDMGRIQDDGAAVDDSIVRTVDMNPPRPDWKFLPKSVTLSPFADRSVLGVPVDQPRVRTFTYDGLGRLVSVRGTLSGTVPLLRSHEKAKRVALAPSSASKDGVIVLAEIKKYDAFGNATLTVGPNDECAGTVFDKLYAHLPLEQVLEPQGCGKGTRSRRSRWDRGFGVVTGRTETDGSTSRVDIDLFGRVVKTYAPDPLSGSASSVPSSQIDYQLSSGGAAQRVKVVSAAGAGRTHTTWSYSDSLGRELLTFEQADAAAGDLGDWVVTGLPERWRGRLKRVYQPWFYSGDPASHPLTPPATASRAFDFDPFGRVSQVTELDGTTAIRRVYRALSAEDIDAAGRVTTKRWDGHGRLASSTLRTASHEQSTVFAYQVGGELAYVARTHDGSVAADSVRWLQYDSFGRVVVNAEPNTSKNFAGPASAGSMRAWRYAYDDAGHLVGTSDARGCGKNITYDALGRSVAEDFSPCLDSHEDYSELDPATGDGAEVLRTYDAPEAGQTGEPGDRPGSLVGRLAATRDRAAHTRFGYDGRGRLINVARQVARPAAVGLPVVPAGALFGAPSTARGRFDSARANSRSSLALCLSLAAVLLFMLRGRASVRNQMGRWRAGVSTLATAASFAMFTTACGGHGAAAGDLARSTSAALTDAGYEANWARSSTQYDDADRLVRQTTGTELPELLGPDGASAVTMEYSLRGAVQSVSGSYGPLLAAEVRDADGLPRARQYADVAGTTAAYDYDARRRLANYSVARAALGPWTTGPTYTPPPAGPTTLQRVLVDSGFGYDAQSNPHTVDDKRDGAAWPSGFSPVDRTMQYDEFDRLARVDYAYRGSAEWSDPLAFERGNGRSPVPSTVAPSRVGSQTFDYDSLGNLRETHDDVGLFYDRSLGAIAHGSAQDGPNQIRSAGPNLTVTHDDAGNLVDLVVQRPGPCTDAAGCVQRFHYDWDEVGQLSRARRWDFTSIDDVPVYPTVPATQAVADLSYLYDGSGVRVLKKSIAAGGDVRYTAEIFGSLRLERATWDEATERYARTPTTEAVYLGGVGRVVHGPTLPSATGSAQHVFLMVPDHLGSTAAVIDRDTGEVVERTTQQAYGAPDSDYRPERWAGFREPYQFTGKEDDFEVGLTYFGARYYHAALGRFASADPLTIHGLGGDSNPYAYVRGAVLSATDPFGLDCSGSIGKEQCAPGSELPPPTPSGGGGMGFFQSIAALFGGFGGGGSSSTPSPRPPTTSPVPNWASQSLIGDARGHADQALIGLEDAGVFQAHTDFAMGMLNEIPFWGPISVGDLLKHPAGLGIKANPDSIPGIIGGGVGQLLMVATAGGETGQSAPGGGIRSAIEAAEGLEATAQGVASDARLFQAYRAELAAQEIQGADAVGSALKSDAYHRSASFVTDTIAAHGKVFSLGNRTGTVNLSQVLGEMNGVSGRFEWIVDGSGNLTHQMFVGGGRVTGVPIAP